MDVRMPVIDGIEATRRLLANVDDPPRILVLTTFENDDYVFDALRAGACSLSAHSRRMPQRRERSGGVARAATRPVGAFMPALASCPTAACRDSMHRKAQRSRRPMGGGRATPPGLPWPLVGRSVTCTTTAMLREGEAASMRESPVAIPSSTPKRSRPVTAAAAGKQKATPSPTHLLLFGAERECRRPACSLSLRTVAVAQRR